MSAPSILRVGLWCGCTRRLAFISAFRLRIVALFALSFIAAIGLPAQTPQPAPAAPPQRPVAIIYDGRAEQEAQTVSYQLKGYIHALFIDNLLGHFGLTGEIIPLKAYQAGQLQRYRAAFFVGVATNAELSDSFLKDVGAYQEPFCWLGQHIEDLVNTREGRRQYGFTWNEYLRNGGVKAVMYKDTRLPKFDPDINVVTVNDARSVQVVATALNQQNASLPYILHRNRFWYFADSPFSLPEEGGYYLAFADLLHDILEIDHKPDHRALARIEDVSIDQDPVDLKHVSDLLAGYNIPFQIALIPIFRNPAKEMEVRLSDKRSFADSVHYMISKGGTPVLHGITHQYRGQSGDDYEFWDDTGDRPIAGDSREFVQRRIQLGLAECFGAGIFPVAFEVPHYAASETDYRAMMRTFSLFYDRTISTPSLNSQQYFPYPVTDYWGRSVLPEDLGYVPIEKPVSTDILQAARNLRVVRDGLASFYFHPFLDIKLLDQVVTGIRELGYRFVSIREFAGEVDYQGRYVVRTASGTAEVDPQNEFWRMRLYDQSGKLVETKLSDGKVTGKIEVAVNVPQGGWAALDCIRERPVEHAEPVFSARIKQWWTQLVASERAPVERGFVSAKKAWILWLDKAPLSASHNQESYRTVLDTFGYDVQLIRAAAFVRAPSDLDTIVVIPGAVGAHLTAEQNKEVLRYITAGGHVVADSRQAWLDVIGVQWQNRDISVSTVTDQLFPEMPLTWHVPDAVHHPDDRVERFTPPEDVRELMVDSESDQVLAYADDYGRGYYIYLAAPLDPHTSEGLSHYPYFPKYLTEVFGANTSLRSPRLEAYFDPSDHPSADLSRLTAQWRKSGIRTIYAAAWNTYPAYYPQLIAACHRNGVSVYAWFAFPGVTRAMWDQHPEWREKTPALGPDGHQLDGLVGWRQQMNMQNPACFRAAMDWMKNLLQSNDWDGVNLTELNFDADFADFLRPDKFVPMNADVRTEFRKKGGFDPIGLFQPASPNYHKTNHAALEKFLKYREGLVTDLHRRVLAELEPMRRAQSWEVIVTALDSLHSKTWGRALGIDSRQIVGLMQDYPFMLQVEDPAEFWMKPPERYLRFAQTYRKLIKDPKRLMFDINVMANRDIAHTTLPSPTATGTELARTVVAAAAASGRVAIYSEHTVPPQDWVFLRIALTRAAELSGTKQWKVNSAVPVLLTPAEDRDYYVDGRLWPAVSSDGVLAPAGRHQISTNRPWYHFLDPGALPARLTSISGDLLDARVMPTGLVLRYTSPGRAVAVFNQRPREILIDGRRVDARMEQNGPEWAVTFPSGDHWVAVVTNTNAGVAVNLWGWASASAINAFGGLATVLMLLIYFEIRLRRLVRRRA
jgi:YD repeat-containing protein